MCNRKRAKLQHTLNTARVRFWLVTRSFSMAERIQAQVEDSTESTPLTPSHVPQQAAPSKALEANFLRLSLFFSAAHACVVTALSLASAELGSRLGSASSGVLYVTYVITAYFMSATIVQKWGAKRAIVRALSLYCAYVAASFVAVTLRPTLWLRLVVVAGALLGGIGAGWMWTAQGAYFAQAADAVSASESDGGAATSSTANARLAGWFGFYYLGCEVVVKVTFSATQRTASAAGWSAAAGVRVAYGMLVALGILATYLLHICVWDNAAGDNVVLHTDTDTIIHANNDVHNIPASSITGSSTASDTGVAAIHVSDTGSAGDNDVRQDSDDNADERAHLPRLCRHTLGAAAMLRQRHGQLLLLAPYEISFGLMTALMLHHVNGSVVKAAVGEQNVSLFSAVLPATAALLAPAFGAACERGALSNPAALLLGIVAFLLELVAVHVLSLPGDAPSASLLAVTVIYALHGVGRATFESANKALLADMFGSTDDVSAAFACVVALSGGASAFGFFVFPHMSVVSMLRLCEVSALTAAVCQVKIWHLNAKKLEAEIGSKAHDVESHGGHLDSHQCPSPRYWVGK